MTTVQRPVTEEKKLPVCLDFCNAAENRMLLEMGQQMKTAGAAAQESCIQVAAKRRQMYG